ncbi:MAG: electron transfer flavoprotein subunit alpha/FixB family protein, partial [Candidatus Thermoplasmatota archaeon]|nr:electron transfer flavoprotein subunit alpha/FixB family protein [Candidatus Thermoplasmatota archaeon]
MSTTIIAEQQEEGIHPTLPQLVHAASIIGGECTIIIPGGGGESEASEIVGVDRVLKFNGSCFSVFDSQSWSSALKGSVGGTVLLASTPRGRELGASLAADIGISVVQDITSISEGINVERPVFSGKAIEKVTISSPAVITIRPNSLDSAGNGASAPVSTIDSGEDLRMAVEEAITKASEKIDVSEADIIISGGRGLGDISNFEKLEEVASTLGAAVGASRAVVDEWGLPHSMQVGQTGKTVTPSLYIAVGISGAIQHLAGMRSSSYIVAINKDPEAPIFTVADYGIVASWEDALPVL